MNDRIDRLAQKTRQRRADRRQAIVEAASHDVPFGTRVKSAMGRADITQKELAKRLGSSNTHINDLVNNRTQIDDKLGFYKALVEELGGRFEISFPGE